MVVVVLMGWCGILCLLVGYVVKKNQSLGAISFPNLEIEKIRDIVGFSRFVGNRFILMGGVALFASLSFGLWPHFTMLAVLLFIISILVIMTELAIHKKRYL